MVSGCHNGIVSVWDILTGEKVMQFQTSPEKSAEVTAMSIDGNKRRLITGSKDGVIRLWNYNNGALLLTLPVLHENEVLRHTNTDPFLLIPTLQFVCTGALCWS